LAVRAAWLRGRREEYTVQAGDIVGGKYVIEHLLGQGGMGAVYLARQERLDRRVAIKFLHAASGGVNPEAHARFEREARAAAVLESEHVTRVLDVGHTDDGAPYMVMEYLQGEDLSAALERRGTLPPAEAVDAVVQACDAIGEAHQRGIVHRDLKPANLFIARRSNGTAIVKVLDFGISKAQGVGAGVALTSTSALVGSPLYMSPEQIREARTVDGRADIWAIGVILYELLTGATPFVSEAFGELCALILTAPPGPVRALRPEVSPALEGIIHRCLQKDPAQRFANVADLVTALRAAERIPAFTPAPPASAPQMSAALPAAARTGDGVANTHASTLPRNRGPLIAAGAGVVAIAIAGALVLGRARSEVSARPAAASLTAPAAPAPASSETPRSPPTTTTAAPPPEPVTTVTPPAPATPTPGQGADTPMAATASSASLAPSKKRGSSGARAADSPPTAAASPGKAPVVDCKVPYIFDSSGNKHFKPECL
jgi:serine/threonine-protein kinase